MTRRRKFRRRARRRRRIDAIDDSRGAVEAVEHLVPASGSRRGIKTQIRVLQRTVDASGERDAEQIGEPEVLAPAARLVEERRRERRQHVAATGDERSNRRALRRRQRRRVREDQQPKRREPLGRQYALRAPSRTAPALRRARDTSRARGPRDDRRRRHRGDTRLSAPSSSSATRASGASLRR